MSGPARLRRSRVRGCWRVSVFAGALYAAAAASCVAFDAAAPDAPAGDAALEDGPNSRDGRVDARVDARGDGGETTGCDLNAPFSTPVLFGTLAGPDLPEEGAWVAGDGVFFGRSSQFGRSKIYFAKLGTDGFPLPGAALEVLLTGVVNAGSPTLGADDLSLIVQGQSANGDAMKFWRATRASAGTLAFGTAVALDVPVGGSLPRINGNELWYSLNIAPNQLELHLTTLNNGALAGAPQVVTSLNSEKDELGAVLTLQGLRVYFASNRSFSKGFDIWTATRPSTKDDFLPATLVTELNSLNDDYPNWVSPDDCWMLLCSQNASTSDIYVARRPAAPTR